MVADSVIFLSLAAFWKFNKVTIDCSLPVSFLSSERRSALDKPLDEVVLLSLAGVGCVVLNQWNSCLQEGTRDMECILDSRFSHTFTPADFHNILHSSALYLSKNFLSSVTNLDVFDLVLVVQTWLARWYSG